MNKSVIVEHLATALAIRDAIPQHLLDFDHNFHHVLVFGQEVIAQQDGKILRRLYTELLGQHINRVLLRVRGNDVGVVA